MSQRTIQITTLDCIYEQVLDNLKRSGQYDEMRVSLIDPTWSDQKFKLIIEDFVVKCKDFCAKMDLRRNRRDLRAKMDDDFPYDYVANKMLRECVKKISDTKREDLKSHFNKYAADYLQKEFKQSSPTHDDQDQAVIANDGPKYDKDVEDEVEAEIDMEIESDFGDAESPMAPEFSPISIDADHDDPTTLNHNESSDINRLQNHQHEPDMTEDIKPSLEDIPMPPGDIPLPVNDIPIPPDDKPSIVDKSVLQGDVDIPTDDIPLPQDEDEQPPTPVQDELPQVDDFNDELESLTLSSVSSVHTNELSDFDQNIELSDDEANIVGKPKKSRIKIEELQGTIRGLQTMAVKREPEEPKETREPKVLKETKEPQGTSTSLLCETSESDACSENASTNRRAGGRQRKSNSRYINGDFTL